MKNAWGLIAGLVVGFLLCFLLTRRQETAPGAPTAADTAAIVAPIKAHAESLQARVNQTLATVGDSTKKYKDRADSLRQVRLARRASRVRAQPSRTLADSSNIATRDTIFHEGPLTREPGDTTLPIVIDTTRPDTAKLVIGGPDTYEQCMEDLNTVEEESFSLRDALTSCENDVERLQGDLTSMSVDYNALLKFRVDTFPQMVKQIRAEPRECKENWVLFKVKCSTAGWIKFGAGGALGFAIAK